MLDITVPESLQGLTLKDFLRRHAGISLSLWRKIKNTGSVSINGYPVLSFHTLLQGGDIITLTWEQSSALIAIAIPLAIKYEDDYVLIVNKPAGMLVHPISQQQSPSLANAVIAYYHYQKLSSGFHPVHRLDRNTSGLILIAKYPHIQHMLSLNNMKSIKRKYLALVSGHLSDKSGFIDAPIGRSPRSIIERIVTSAGKPALTLYKVIATFPGYSLLELELLTGRTHQIRVHLSHIGHPLLGDDLYGGPIDLIKRQALHSYCLSFQHPVQNQPVYISCPIPEDMSVLTKQ
ncbi:hypothetical protein P22_3994 [Propionispora sp. 2/2-37]|uniref:RluA family pseudouridine synthase n=1 Tax=Propionispora sp. 2/2-37 TaxID=1677858 RepID=UPI0006BB5FA4|nr:RluA family pseudouridine synthase [Propionispora sp. 2/2-37]CUH97847.1 hypothetical protein P22_3994 [Propionispora sp. 2/2-37]